MRDAWKAWEGRVVNREFRLGDYLGGSERAGVFATQYGPDSRKAAVKLIPIGDWDQARAEAELARLQSARELSHPHLIQILQAGRTTVDDTELLFVVMEHADEDLSQILPTRPLAGGEVREMLAPMIEALAYVHSKGLVHGHLKPTNVMAIGDQLKLSSEGISASGAASGVVEGSEYDAPEIARGENSASSDVWSLGMLLVMTLTQRLPGWDADGHAILPENLPGQFDDIARNCLQREPGARWSLAEIARHAGVSVPAPSATVARQEARESAVASPAPARPQLAPVAKTSHEARQFPYQRNSNTGAYVAAAVVLVIVSALVVPRLFRRGALNSQSPSQNSQTAKLPKDSVAKKESKASPKAPVTNSRIAQVSDDGASRDAATGTADADVPETPAKLAVTRETAMRRGLSTGQVAEQIVPDVPESARKTIHGTVRVGVRVSVDSSGNVTEAELDSPGPSKYFAHLALEAAQQWKFDPPKMQGRNVLSDWLLHFQFTGKGTKVIPVQSDP